MWRHPFAAVLLAAALIVLAVPAASGAQQPKVSAAAQARTVFAQLVAQTRTLPHARAKARRARRALVRTASAARRAAIKRPCRARTLLRKYRRQLRRVRARRIRARTTTAGSARGRLRAAATTAEAALLILPRAKRCGGAKPSGVSETKTTVLASDERHLKLHVDLPPAQFVSHQVGGKDFLEMTMEGMGQSGDVGDPGPPAKTSLFAVPEGADVNVSFSNVKGYELNGVNLYPRQPQPVDQKPPSPIPPIDTFLEPPFKIDGKAYKSNGPFPAAPADGGSLGAMRDLLVGGVDSAGGQYKPKSQKLKVFTSMDVTVDFGGNNTGVFGPADLLSPWNRAFADDYGALVNLQAVIARLRANQTLFCGEELLIITSHELRPAADTLRAQRQAQGYATLVREVGTGPGQIGALNTDIQTYIQSQLNAKTCLL